MGELIWGALAIVGIITLTLIAGVLLVLWALYRNNAAIRRKMPPDPSAASRDLHRQALHRVGLSPDDPGYEEAA